MDGYDYLFWAILAILIVYIVRTSRKTYGVEGLSADTLQRTRVITKAQQDEEILAKATAGRNSGPVGCSTCRRGM